MTLWFCIILCFPERELACINELNKQLLRYLLSHRWNLQFLQLKCAQYWPEEVGTESIYGKVKVRLVTSLCDDICTQREMSVSYGGHTRIVTQWHYKEWQDCKGPQDAKNLIDFIRRVRRSNPRPPILVHCRYCFMFDLFSDKLMVWFSYHIC